jgi:hypothetical protein
MSKRTKKIACCTRADAFADEDTALDFMVTLATDYCDSTNDVNDLTISKIKNGRLKDLG